MTKSTIPATDSSETSQKLPKATLDASGELSPAQQAAVNDYVREMIDTVIPEIIRVVEERRKLASASRQMSLKVGG